MKMPLMFPLLAIILILGCGDETTELLPNSEHSEGSHNEEGEESNTQYGITDSFDETRSGARLLLLYDPNTSSFVGSVENTTGNILKNVRVEVHLSNGTELGPTTPRDLSPSESMKIELDATGQAFDTWSAHPEVG